MHQDGDKPFVLAAIGLYAFDYLLRCIKTRIHTATLRSIPELGVTRVEIPQINSGWRAGQHVRLRVLSSGMGFGCMEVHPFTIASADNSPEGMVLLVKKVGGWTTKLYDIARTGRHSEAGVGTNVKVMIDGPYGTLQLRLLHVLELTSLRRSWSCYSCEQLCRRFHCRR